jgi:hypothetical protein
MEKHTRWSTRSTGFSLGPRSFVVGKIEEIH